MKNWGGVKYIANGNEVYDSLSIEITPKVERNQYFLTVGNNATFKVTGTTFFQSYSKEDNPSWDEGTYAFYTNGSGASIQLLGDINALVVHDESIDIDEIGANLFYAKDEATITLGKDGTTSKAWVIAKTPDLISAKNGGKVHIESKNNQFVGSIDMLDTAGLGTKGSEVKGSFDGANSYWYGDEHSFMNLAIDLPDILLDADFGFRKGMLVSEIVSIVQNLEDADKEAIKKALGEKLFNTILGYELTDSLDLTFSNGAEWSYLGQIKTKDIGSLTGSSLNKRISSITLNGGVINLADDYLKMRWDVIGLSDVLDIEDGFKHDYVRIGDLKGSEGIFRIDLNGENKALSDMIFVESSSTGGTHKIEPYKLETLTKIANSDEQLIFAMTQESANNVKFEDQANFYGETLFDYEVEIDSQTITEEVLDSYRTEGYIKYEDFYDGDYLGGTAWYIERVTLKQSTASIGMRGAGYASYDAVVQMDRYDRRLKEVVFEDGSSSGLWIRVQHGQMGAKDAYSSDISTVHMGVEGQLTDTLRLGASFSYLDGDADLLGIKGSNEIERYEGSVYGTFESGAHYVDVVARLGQVNNDFMTSNAVVSKSGTFHQKYVALSAEYGYKAAMRNGFFIEPQVQAQGAYLGGYETTVAGGMRMKADQATSLIGRVGMRLGKSFKNETVMAEVYARGDVLHQFTDGQDAVLSNDYMEHLSVAWGDVGTWYNYGLGGYVSWKNKFGMQFDVEKSSGGEVTDSWLLTGRLNYYF